MPTRLRSLNRLLIEFRLRQVLTALRPSPSSHLGYTGTHVGSPPQALESVLPLGCRFNVSASEFFREAPQIDPVGVPALPKGRFVSASTVVNYELAGAVRFVASRNFTPPLGAVVLEMQIQPVLA